MELGLKFQPFVGSQARLAVWQQDAEHEVANMPATGTTVTLGKTRRRGVDAQLSLQLGDDWTYFPAGPRSGRHAAPYQQPGGGLPRQRRAAPRSAGACPGRLLP
ncbi:hypothetical protein G6F58_013540 [Rhizopus delemar]|nr:hypothetical protein G6F58_013540 [Rhizopus delemar]